MKKKKKLKIKVRRKWSIHPATRVEEARVKYDRHRLKKETGKIVEEEGGF